VVSELDFSNVDDVVALDLAAVDGLSDHDLEALLDETVVTKGSRVAAS
jgi:hypothetical protein